ncbi:MAG: phage tail tape measure protein [Chitinophagales bacterium]
MSEIAQSRKVNVFINNTQAKGSIKEMEAEVRKFTNEWKKAKAGTKEYDDTLKKLTDKKSELDFHKNQIKNFSLAWKSVHNEVDATTSRINANTAALNKNAAAWKKSGNDASASTNRALTSVKKLNAETSKSRTVWQEMLFQGKVFGGLALGYLGVTAVLSKIGSGVQNALKMSDALAGVQKTTGMTTEEVEKLNDQFGSFDTRTARTELLALAKEGGKLGVAKEDILGFVRAADKIKIALGEDLGDDAINSIGKIVNIFKLKDQFGLEDAMLKVGSAINSVGQSSEASEGYIVDFLNRMGGIAPLAKISVTDIIALGSVLDSLGQTSETSSTALSKLFIKMADDAETYAKFAGMSTQEFIDLLDKNALEAFLRVLEGANKTSNGLVDLTASLGELGIEGGRATGVFGTLANNTDEVRKAMSFANEEFEKGNSINKEFTTNNTTLAASFDKLMKRINGYIMNNDLTKWLTQAIDYLGDTRRESQKLTDEWKLQKEASENLEAKMRPLYQRYNQLTNASLLSKEEQTELRSIIDQIAAAIPTAVTKWDEYGNAIAISTGKVVDAIHANKRMAELLNADAIKTSRKEIEKMQNDVKKLVEELNAGGKKQTTHGRQGSYTELLKFDDEEAKEQLAIIQGFNAQIVNSFLKLEQELGQSLSGEDQFAMQKAAQMANISLDAYFGVVQEIKTTTEDAIKEEEKYRTEEEKKELEKRTQNYQAESERLKKFIEQNQKVLFLNSLNENEKEIQQIKDKYAEEIDLAKNHKVLLVEIEELMNAEIAAKRNEQQVKLVAEQEAFLLELEALTYDEEQSAIAKINAEFQNLYDTLVKLGLANDHTVQNIMDAWDKALQNFNEAKMLAIGEGIAKGLEAAFSKVNKAAEQSGNKLKETDENIIASKQALAEATFYAGAAAVDSANEEVSAAKSVLNAIKQEIKAYIAKAIAIQIGKILAKVPFPLNIVLAGIAGGAVSALLNKVLPTFAQGGFTHDARMYIAGEKGQEYIASNKQVNDPVTGPVIQGLEYHRTTGRYPDWMTSSGYAPNSKFITSYTGGNNGSYQSNTTAERGILPKDYAASNSTELSRLISLLEKLEKNGLRAYFDSDERWRTFKELERIEELEKRSRK